MSDRLISDDTIAILTVWMEARGQPMDGQQGVAEVILRRTKNRFQSDGTITSTCLWPLAFSAWNATDRQRMAAIRLLEDSPGIPEARAAWYAAQLGSDLSKGANSYLNPATLLKLSKPLPKWASDEKFTVKIADHCFYKV